MSTPPHAGRTALVIDDDQSLLDLLAELLTDEGFTVSSYVLSRPAVDAMAQQRFDLIITDVNLPDMSGLELCDVAREQYGDDAVILVITGAKIQDCRVTSLELGADDFLGKPFDLDELLARIEAKLRRLPAPRH